MNIEDQAFSALANRTCWNCKHSSEVDDFLCGKQSPWTKFPLELVCTDWIEEDPKQKISLRGCLKITVMKNNTVLFQDKANE